MSWRTAPGRPRLTDCWKLAGVLIVIRMCAGAALQPRLPTYSTNRRNMATGRGERHGPGTLFGLSTHPQEMSPILSPPKERLRTSNNVGVP
jgi:hypothetical protein